MVGAYLENRGYIVDCAAVDHGVGLTVVKRLSDRFGWPLRIDSVPEEGTRVEILFKTKG